MGETLPIFCTPTETVVDLPNVYLRCSQPYRLHKLENCAEAMVIANLFPIHPALAKLSLYPYIKVLSTNPTAYADVFVDDFWA